MSPAARTQGAVWGILIAVVLALTVAVVLDLRVGFWATSLTFVPFCVVFAVVGAVVLLRTRSRTMGWLFLLVGADVAACLLFGSYARFAGSRGLPGAAWAAVGFIVAIWLSVVVCLVLQLFPDGTPLSYRWKLLVQATWGVVAIGVLASALSEQDDFGSNFPTLQHPAQVIPEPLAGYLYTGAQFAWLGLLLTSAGVVAVRYRRSRGIERLQMKWLVAAGVLAAVGFVAAALWSQVVDASVAFAFLMPLVPIACGFAILRYHLYDVDRIISRTTSYALVTGLLLVVYVSVVWAVPQLLPKANDLAVAAATLAAAALFRPLLSRVRSVVDRRFDRSRYDADRAVEEFAVRLREEVDSGEISEDLLSVLDRTVQPAVACVSLIGRSP